MAQLVVGLPDFPFDTDGGSLLAAQVAQTAAEIIYDRTDSAKPNMGPTAPEGRIRKSDVSIAKAFAESEFEKYRAIQDRLYQSDFDRLVASTVEKD